MVVDPICGAAGNFGFRIRTAWKWDDCDREVPVLGALEVREGAGLNFCVLFPRFVLSSLWTLACAAISTLPPASVWVCGLIGIGVRALPRDPVRASSCATVRALIRVIGRVGSELGLRPLELELDAGPAGFTKLAGDGIVPDAILSMASAESSEQ
jgi:hypothetical protein